MIDKNETQILDSLEQKKVKTFDGVNCQTLVKSVKLCWLHKTLF